MNPLVTIHTTNLQEIARSCVQGNGQLEDAVLALADRMASICRNAGLSLTWMRNVKSAVDTLRNHRRGAQQVLEKLEQVMQDPVSHHRSVLLEELLLKCRQMQNFGVLHVQGMVDLSLQRVMDRIEGALALPSKRPRPAPSASSKKLTVVVPEGPESHGEHPEEGSWKVHALGGVTVLEI